MSEVLAHLSWFDLAFAILLLGTVYKGSRRGVGFQMLSLSGYMVLVYFALGYYTLLSEAIFGFLFQGWAKPISFLFISLVVLFIIKILERFFLAAEQEELAFIERVGGMLVGGLRGGILIGLLGIFFLLLPVGTGSISEGRSVFCRHLVEMDLGLYSWMRRLTKSDIPSKDEHLKNFSLEN